MINRYAVKRAWHIALLVCGLGEAMGRERFDPADYEEFGGSAFLVFGAPEQDLYGVGFSFGTWLKGFPVLGDYQLRGFYHGRERAYYSGVGMTLRLMPRWAAIAPYLGAGGNYNHSLSDENDALDAPETSRGESYWNAHAEAGIRLQPLGSSWFYEGAVRRARNFGPADDTQFFVVLGQGPPRGRVR